MSGKCKHNVYIPKIVTGTLFGARFLSPTKLMIGFLIKKLFIESVLYRYPNRCFQNPVGHLTWSLLWKYLTYRSHEIVFYALYVCGHHFFQCSFYLFFCKATLSVFSLVFCLFCILNFDIILKETRNSSKIRPLEFQKKW